MFRNNIRSHYHHLEQTTQGYVYKNAPNCDVENSVVFCATRWSDSLRNFGGKKYPMIKDAAIRGLSALSVSGTMQRSALMFFNFASSWSLLHTGHNSTTECGTQISPRRSCKKTSNRRSKELAANTSQKRMKGREGSRLRGKLNVKETWRK